MNRLSMDKDINAVAVSLVKRGWRCRNGRKHWVLIAPNTRRLAVPSTPSDRRHALKNFIADVRRISSEVTRHVA